MGSKALLTTREVAETLNITVSAVNQLTRNGSLRPYYERGRSLKGPRQYRTDHVEAYQKARKEGHKADLPSVYNRALQAEVLSETLLKRVETLETLLGLNAASLPYTPVEVRSLAERVNKAIERPPSTAKELMEWGGIFLGIHEEYFELIAQYTNNPEPWKPLYLLGRIVREQHKESKPLDVKQAYAYFNSAYRNMRKAMFIYIRNQGTVRDAEKALPEESGKYLDHLLYYLPQKSR